MKPERFFRSPGAMGYTCDGLYPDHDGDAPLLLRCQDQATHRLVLADELVFYAVKRCDSCAAALHAQVNKSITLTILQEETL